MRIVQLTDIHVSLPHEETRGIDTRENFITILHEINQVKPDLLVITGDVSFKAPHQEIYDWVAEHLHRLDYEVLIIGGNHDDITMIPQRYLPAHLTADHERYFSRMQEDETNLIFLDTHEARMSETQLSWLSNQLSLGTRQIIFMHHPPVYAGVGYMDLNHAFKSMDEFQSVLSESQQPVPIFCGHYHVEKTIHFDRASVHITPSTFFQIVHDQDEFGVDHKRIGFRIIDVAETIMHRVEYFEGHKQS